MIFGIPAYLAGITPTWLEYKPEAGIVIRTVAGLVAASTLLHYYCDGLLWRLREPSTGRVLQLLAGPASDGRVWPWRASAARAVRGAILLLLMLLLLGLHGRERARPEVVSANLVQTVPMSWHAHARYGEQLLVAGERPRAVEHLLQALELHPDAVEARCTLGRALRQLGDFAGALRQFEEAVTLAPRSVTARAEFGKTLFAVGRLSEGREQLQRAVQLAPRRAMAHYELAVAEMESGNYAAALTSIDRALELDANHAMLYHLRGRIRGYLDDLPRALTDFEHALTLNPSLAGAYRDRAGVFYLTGDLPRALRDINKAIELEVANWRNLVLRGDVYFQQGDFGRARDDYATAMASCGRDPEPAERMISLLTQCPDPAFRRPDQAMALAHALCRESGYADVRSLQVLAETCAAVGYYDEAVYWQNQALSLAPVELQPQLRQRLEQFERERAEPPSETGHGKADMQPDNRVFATPPATGPALRDEGLGQPTR
jgi:tetratricopeptide (TPR) repeat protein